MTSSRPPALNVLMFAMGSAGDVYPFVGVGKALRERGHSVSLVANSYFEPIIREARIDFISGGPASDYLEVIQNPELWQSKGSYRLMLEKMLDAVPFTYSVIAERHARDGCVVVAPATALGARIAQEKLSIPLIGLNVETNIFRSAYELRGRTAPPVLRPLMPLFRRPMMDIVDRWFLDPQLMPRLNDFRAKLGLHPVQRVMRNWLHSPTCVIGLMPEWFAAMQPDWPPNVHLTGFPLFDVPTSDNAPPEVSEFLNGGEPPVVFTLGTAMYFGKEFFQTSADICRSLGIRGIFLTRFSEQIPSILPAGVQHFSYMPFRSLFPRSAAVVHHGGIGTTAEALRAGIPQLIVPMIFDQPDNAARLRRMGAGDSLRPNRYKPVEAATRLHRLLTSGEVRLRCREIARRLTEDDSLNRTCSVIETAAAGGRELLAFTRPA